MNEVIELAIDSSDGIIDCRLEQEENDGEVVYAATILYPCLAGGHSRSDIFCCNMVYDARAAGYVFDDREEIHPKIQALELQLSAAIANEGKGMLR